MKQIVRVILAYALFFNLLAPQLVAARQGQQPTQQSQAEPEKESEEQAGAKIRELVKQENKEYEIEFETVNGSRVYVYKVKKPGAPWEYVNVGAWPLRKGGVQTGAELTAHAKDTVGKDGNPKLTLQNAIRRYDSTRRIEVNGKEMDMAEATVWMIERGYWSVVKIIPGSKDAEFDAGAQPNKEGTDIEIKSPVKYVGDPREKDPEKKAIWAFMISFPFLKIIIPMDCGQPYFSEIRVISVEVICGPALVEEIDSEIRRDEQGNEIKVVRLRWYRLYEEPGRKGELCGEERVQEIKIPIPKPVIKEVPGLCEEKKCQPEIREVEKVVYTDRLTCDDWVYLGGFGSLHGYSDLKQAPFKFSWSEVRGQLKFNMADDLFTDLRQQIVKVYGFDFEGKKIHRIDVYKHCKEDMFRMHIDWHEGYPLWKKLLWFGAGVGVGFVICWVVHGEKIIELVKLPGNPPTRPGLFAPGQAPSGGYVWPEPKERSKAELPQELNVPASAPQGTETVRLKGGVIVTRPVGSKTVAKQSLPPKATPAAQTPSGRTLADVLEEIRAKNRRQE